MKSAELASSHELDNYICYEGWTESIVSRKKTLKSLRKTATRRKERVTRLEVAKLLSAIYSLMSDYKKYFLVGTFVVC